MFEDEECQLTQVTPTQNPAKRPPKVKNDSGQNEKPSSERNSIRLQRKRDYEMKEDSPQRQKSVRLDDGDDYEPNIRSKPKSKPKLKNVKPQTFSNPQQQHSIQEADTGLWNRTNLPVEYSCNFLILFFFFFFSFLFFLFSLYLFFFFFFFFFLF